MPTPELDQRSQSRRQRDEQIAAEPKLLPLELPAEAPSSSVEDQLVQHRLRRAEEFPKPPDEAFRQAADNVLRKNADLYRRLA
jgi:hypothetical protein